MSEDRSAEKKIMSEIELLLADFEISKTTFIEHTISLEEWNGDEQKRQLERGNTFQYFKGSRPIPLAKLWRILYYLDDYKDEFEDEQQREIFCERVENIIGKVIAYTENQKNAPAEIKKAIKATLEKMQDRQIETLFDSLHIFTIPENIWNFWACYCCLDSEAQKKIRKLLSSYPLSPMAYGVNFYQYRLWDSDIHRPTLVKFGKSLKKYNQTGKSEEDRKRFINGVSTLLFIFPYSFRNIAQNFHQRATAPSEMTVGIHLYRFSRGVKRPEVWQTTEQEAQAEIDGLLLTYEKTISITDEGGTIRNVINYRTYTKKE